MVLPLVPVRPPQALSPPVVCAIIFQRMIRRRTSVRNDVVWIKDSARRVRSSELLDELLDILLLPCDFPIGCNGRAFYYHCIMPRHVKFQLVFSYFI